jgi:hypothetical protein
VEAFVQDFGKHEISEAYKRRRTGMKASSQHSALSVVTFLNLLGKSAIDLVDNLGAATIFFSKTFLMIFRPKQLPEIIEQSFQVQGKSLNGRATVEPQSERSWQPPV